MTPLADTLLCVFFHSCSGTFSDFLDSLNAVPIAQAIQARLRPTWTPSASASGAEGAIDPASVWGEPEAIQARREDEDYLPASIEHVTPFVDTAMPWSLRKQQQGARACACACACASHW